MAAIYLLSRARTGFTTKLPYYFRSISSLNHHQHPSYSSLSTFLVQNLTHNLTKSPFSPSFTNPLNLYLPTNTRFYSSQEQKPISNNATPVPNPDSNHQIPKPTPDPEFKHQEIEGPTVERDLSLLANEMRQVHEKLMKTIYNTSKALGVLALIHLSCGAWVSYAAQSSPLHEVSIQSFAAFAFPFSVAFLLRWSLKPMSFFRKMEEQGRLQILTLSLQVAKSLDVFFVRVRGVSFLCMVGMLVGFLVNIVSK